MTKPITERRHSQLPNENSYSIRAQILTRITRMILVIGKNALSVPDTRFSRVSGSTLVPTICLIFEKNRPFVYIEKS